MTKLGLAESALHGPVAGFGDTGSGFGDIEFYPDFIDKATVLIVHLAKNHPLPGLARCAAALAPVKSCAPAGRDTA